MVPIRYGAGGAPELARVLWGDTSFVLAQN